MGLKAVASGGSASAALNSWTPSFAALDASAGAPSSGGTGHAVGDIVGLGNGVFVTVNGVSGGVITSFNVSSRGAVSSVPAQPQAQVSTTGSGIGASFGMSYAPIAATVQFAPQGAGGNNGTVMLGPQAGIGLNGAALGNTGFGYGVAGSGLNNLDGMGGGTGMQATATENTLIGYRNGTQITTGNFLTYIGHHAGGHETTGDKQAFVGTDAGKWVTAGHELTGVGANTQKFLISPSWVTSVGGEAVSGGFFQATVTGAANNGSGKIRLAVNSTTGMATGDTVVVTDVLGTTEANAVWSGVTIVDGTHIDLNGSTFTNSYVISSGAVKGFGAVGLTNITAVGYAALGSTALRTGATRLVAVGSNALVSLTTAVDTTAVGHSAGTALTTGGNNTAVGSNALAGTTTISNDTAIGYNTLNAQDTGGNNTAVGSSALSINSSAANNVAVGNLAGQFVTAGGNNTAVGANSLQGVSPGTPVTGTQNTIIGNQAGQNISSGGSNTALGFQALQSNSGAPLQHSGHTALGWQSLKNVQGVSDLNAGLGYKSGSSITTGSGNVAVGPNVASTTLTTGGNNVLIGTTSAIDTPAAGTNNTIQIGAGSTAVFFATGASNPATSAAGVAGTWNTGGFTVATLPTGTVGMRAYVTDATAPTFLGALTGGGAVKTPVFYNGTAWVAG